jgi:hypothetical protein
MVITSAMMPVLTRACAWWLDAKVVLEGRMSLLGIKTNVYLWRRNE